ncbi:Hypothetical predicted protein [Prunus dulcis]|uniref:Uncharacterized protein n=1 Tax=Prunus dulcis TaxID=3755 RepID=A0A5E4G143_PRUDU|nr:Hypothetical predicted protein [Prunus dulcis]
MPLLQPTAGVDLHSCPLTKNIDHLSKDTIQNAPNPSLSFSKSYAADSSSLQNLRKTQAQTTTTVLSKPCLLEDPGSAEDLIPFTRHTSHSPKLPKAPLLRSAYSPTLQVPNYPLLIRKRLTLPIDRDCQQLFNMHVHDNCRTQTEGMPKLFHLATCRRNIGWKALEFLLVSLSNGRSCATEVGGTKTDCARDSFLNELTKIVVSQRYAETQ